MRKFKRALGRAMQVGSAAVAAAVSTGSAHAGTDVTEIVTSATTTFAAVATLCVTIGVFMVGYRLARKVR